jgi:hypothetical protein
MNDSNAEVITLEVDDTQVRPAVDRANAALDSYGKKAVTSINSASRAYEDHGNLLVRTNDRSRSSVERLIASVEKQAQAYGKTGVERLISQRDQLIQRLGNEEAGIRRVTVAYDQMIAAEKRLASESATAGAQMGQSFQGARGSLALLGVEMGVRVPRQLRGFLAELPGVGVAMEAAFAPLAILGLIEIIGTAVEKIGELKDSWDPVYQAQKRAMDKGKDLLKDYEETISKTNDAIRKGIVLTRGEGAALQYDVGNLELDVNSNDRTRIQQVQGRLTQLNYRADQYTTDSSGRQHLTEDAQAAVWQRNMAQKELENANAKLGSDQRELANKRLELEQWQAEQADKAAKEHKAEVDKANAEEHRLLTERNSFLRRFNKYLEERVNKTENDLGGVMERYTAAGDKEATKNNEQMFGDARGALSFLLPGGGAGSFGESQAAMKARIEHEGRMGGIGISDPIQAATQSTNARLALINAVYQRETAILDVNRDSEKISELKAKADLDSAEARYQLEEKIADAQQKQFEEISKTSAGLFHTLFTSPRQFGGQLTSTIRDAALSPVTSALGNITASFLSPMLGGGKLNDVQLIGGAVPVHIVNIGGGGGTSVYGGGGFSGGFSSGGGTDGGGYSGGGWSGGLSSVFGPGGTPGFAPGPIGIGGGSGGGSGALNRILGGFAGGNGEGGWAGMLKNLKSITLGGATMSPSRWRMDEEGNMTQLSAGRVTGMNGLLGMGMTAGGMMLAQNGIFGEDRGTASGTFQGMLGGAFAGMAMGGPVGAAIGAGIGLLTGIGEMIAGVESPQHQAKRLIQSIYGVNVPERGGIVQQIVQMAQQYGGSVSMSVRTPQARQLIELYSMSTGQGSRGMFLDTPRSASLVQSGSQLFQGLSYFDGAGYNFASSLPNLNHSSGTIPTFNPYSGGGAMSFSLDGPATTALLSGQVVRTATPGYVAQQNVQALNSGGSRYSQAAALISPSTIFA